MKTITLSGAVGYEITLDSIKEQVSAKSTEKLQVIVNSPGGYVSDAFEIYNFFKMYKGEVKISAFKNSIFMAHKAWGLAIGNSDELQKEAEIMGAMDNVLAEAYSGKMGKDKKEVLDMMKNELWLIGWESLTESGIIDNVIDKDEEIEWEESEDSESIKEDLEELDKCGDDKEKQSRATLKVIQCQGRMRADVDRARKASEKAVALLEIKNEQESEPAESGEDKIKTEAHMKLQDFLKSDPEAKAEYELDLLSAEARGEEKVKADMGKDRARIANILEMSGIEGLTDSVIEAIESNISAGEFAQAELKRQKEKRADVKESVFAGLTAKQTPGEQDAKGAEEVKGEVEFDVEKMKANVKKSLDEIGG